AAEIRVEVDRLGLRDNVHLLGWKDHALLPAYYQRASVGLLPFLDTGQIKFTLANKLFDYMGAGLPVIASDVPPMRRIVSETGAGLLVAAGDPEGLGVAIVRLLQGPREERRRMSECGIRAVRDKYNWEVDSKRLVDAVQRESYSGVEPSAQALT